MNLRLPCAAALTVLALGACASSSDSVRRARAANESTALRASEEAGDFLVEMVDARRMDYAEGSLAMTRATTQELRDYGAEMTRDQSQLLGELTDLAASLRVSVPDSISEAKRGPLQDLVNEQGTDFDKRFIAMITIDHERNVKAFAQAAELPRDPTVRVYAQRRLPLIRRHLDEIEAIRKSR